MSNIAWGRFAFWSTVIIGSGYGIMKFTTPTAEQLYDELAPDLKRQVDERREARKRGELQQRAEQAVKDGSTGPVWATTPKGGKGG